MRTSVAADEHSPPADTADYYVRVPVKLLELGPFAVAVYTTLGDYAHKETGACWPSHATIAKRSGVSVSKVQRVLIELRQAGWVTWSNREDDNGAKVLSNRYVIHRTPQVSVPRTDRSVPETDTSVPRTEVSVGRTDESVPDTEGVGTRYREGSVPRTEELITSEPRTNELSMVTADATTTAQSDGYPADFLEFWQVYPLKKGKGAALDEYRKARKRVSHQHLMDAVTRLANDPNLPADRSKIPHARTWLHQRRYDDEDAYPEQHLWPVKPPSASRMFADTAALLAMPGLEIAQ